MVTADELRPKYGLLAEHVAILANMSELEWRLYVDGKLSGNAQSVREEAKSRNDELGTHHHHSFGRSSPCNEAHGGGEM